MGHAYCAIGVMILTFLIYKEVISLNRKEEKDNKNIFSWMDKYYFGVFMFSASKLIFLNNNAFKSEIDSSPILIAIFYEYQKLISYLLFVFGILIFVWSLRRGQLRYQFKRLAQTILCLMMVYTIPSSSLYLIYKGLYWFLIPHLSVIFNDTFAYLFGFMFGRTPLFMLAPRKTWEGFIGGLLFNLVLTFIASDKLALFPYLTCP